MRAQTALGRFYWFDVKPAIRARRRQPQEDVNTQVLERGFCDLDVLTECVTYGAAGMVTTRELITVGAWHLLEDPELLRRFRGGDRAERTQILNETLRLEPVVGHLLRRATRATTLHGENATVQVEPGDLVDLDLRAANADPQAVGEEPLGLCPDRHVGTGVLTSAMSLGDGHHRCPGGPIGLMEAEVFLAALFRWDIVADGPPRVRWNPVTLGYDLDGLMLRLDQPRSATVTTAWRGAPVA
ncbi:MAG: cytochrome P450 [Lapillicoccus sp.]